MKIVSSTVSLLVLFVLGTVQVGACQGQSPEKSWTVASIQKLLAANGIQARTDVAVKQPYLSVPGKVLVAGDGTEIQTYIYKSVSARESDSRKLDAKRAAPPDMRPHWLMPVSLVADGNALLIVLSNDDGQHRKIASLFAPGTGQDESRIETIVRSFHEALQRRDVKAIEGLVTPDLVVFENGGRNDGWPDFRDNHLIPELQEPAPQSTWELVKAKANGNQAWAYTHETFKSARGTPMVLWSLFVLEKRGPEWKIVVLDWSIGRAK